MERIQKIMAAAGIASRRACEKLIAAGKVTVNGKTAQLGQNADPIKDHITVNGKPITLEQKTYLILNKPPGYVTTVREEHDMKTVMQLIKTNNRVYPVGRLDKNTEGLLLFTNDGDLAAALTHPRFGVTKEYIATLDKTVNETAIENLLAGVEIDGKIAKPSHLEATGKTAIIIIHEGRKHIVRNLFASQGLYVKKLVRVRMATLELGNLAPGKTRALTPKELIALKNYLSKRTERHTKKSPKNPPSQHKPF